MTDSVRRRPAASNRTYLIRASLLVWSLVLFTGLAYAGDTIVCAAGQPCFMGSRQEGNNIVFHFNGAGERWDYYNVRYAVAGGEKQVENRSGTFTLNNVSRPNRVYTLNWLRVLGTAELPHINQGVRQQVHAKVSWLHMFKPQQQPFECILPRKGPIDPRPQGMDGCIA
jgi:hypothetical protein